MQDEVHPENGGTDQEVEKLANREEKSNRDEKEAKVALQQDGEGEEGFHGFPQSPEAEATSECMMAISKESSTKELVLAAITVMKGRKARPDTRRLCNWVHRKYGRPVQVGEDNVFFRSSFICVLQAVVNEIDSLCTAGVLEKVCDGGLGGNHSIRN